MSTIAESLAREYPASNTDMGVRLMPMIDAVAGSIRPTLRLLMGAVAVLLLIACANVANLLLARGLGRERETSIRSALGASRLRLVRLFFIEGLLLGVAAASSGLLLAGWGVRLLRGVPGLALPRRGGRVDQSPGPRFYRRAGRRHRRPVRARAGAAAVAGGPDARAAPGGHWRGLVAAQRAAPLALVAIEVALLVVLLTAAALMQRSLSRLAAVDLGFDADKVVSVPLQQLRSRYADDKAIYGFADALLESAGAQIGAAGAALAWPFDYTGFTWATNINRPGPSVRGREGADRADRRGHAGLLRGDGHSDPARPRLRIGRTARGAGLAHRQPDLCGAVLSRRGSDRQARALRCAFREMQNMPIIGVVGDTRRGGMLRGFTPEIYIAYAQFPQAGATLVVRARAARSADAGQRPQGAGRRRRPRSRSGTMRRLSDAHGATYGDRRALSWLLASSPASRSVSRFSASPASCRSPSRSASGDRRPHRARREPRRRGELIIERLVVPVIARRRRSDSLALVPLSRVYPQLPVQISPPIRCRSRPRSAACCWSRRSPPPTSRRAARRRSIRSPR